MTYPLCHYLQKLRTHVNKKHSTYIQCRYKDYLDCTVEETQKKKNLLRKHAFIFVLEEPFIPKVFLLLLQTNRIGCSQITV
jgi:hypothetical protein